jgi:hypothetical protein
LDTDTDWPALLADYQAALEEFERTSRALTAALLHAPGPNGEGVALLAAETRARDAVVLTRMRLMNAWRDSDSQMVVPSISNAPHKMT